MRKFLKILVTICLILPILYLFHVNFKLFYVPEIKQTTEGSVNLDVIRQLHFVGRQLHENNAGTSMQELYPEGFVFINALYGLTWYDAISELKSESPYRKEALKELTWASNQINSDTGRWTFYRNLPIEYGAFYRGWNNLLIARKLALQNPAQRNPAEIRQFQVNCEQIADYLRTHETPFAESYSDMAWAADMVVCVASLSAHDRIFKSKYKELIQNWIQKVKKRLDPQTGLIAHAANAETGYTQEGARGSSMSLMLAFLPEIDSIFAREQFLIYKKHFLDKRLGLPGIREYPKGNNGLGDVDSGPVIWGIGGSASIVGLKVMNQQKDNLTAMGLRNSLEGFGIPISGKTEKKYLFGTLPMADAFLAWANAGKISTENISGGWRMEFQLISILIVVILIGFLGLIWRFGLSAIIQKDKKSLKY